MSRLYAHEACIIRKKYSCRNCRMAIAFFFYINFYQIHVRARSNKWENDTCGYIIATSSTISHGAEFPWGCGISIGVRTVGAGITSIQSPMGRLCNFDDGFTVSRWDSLSARQLSSLDGSIDRSNNTRRRLLQFTCDSALTINAAAKSQGELSIQFVNINSFGKWKTL